MSVIIEVKNYSKFFPVKTGFMKTKELKALNDVSFTIEEEETLGVIGESGCGKSTLGKTILGINEATSGELYYRGQIVTKESRKDIRNKFQMIFQDSASSLNPKMTIFDSIKEPIIVLKRYSNKKEIDEKVYNLMDLVGLRKEYSSRYPYEFSGGQLQRVNIARALAAEPEFIVCDEPVSALDVSIKAQIINLFLDIQKLYHESYLFITHDILSARYICNRILIMYLGRVMEIGKTNDIINQPIHPYTKALLSAVYPPDYELKGSKTRIQLEGEIPSPLNTPAGCPYHTRCPYAKDVCKNEIPELKDLGNGRKVACHLC